MAKPCANKRELGIANWPLNTDVIGTQRPQRKANAQAIGVRYLYLRVLRVSAAFRGVDIPIFS
ncbi:hypothetical protein ACVBKF_19550, partial [Shewanella sp. 0m-11]